MSESKASLDGVCGLLFSAKGCLPPFELSGSAKRLFLATWESRTPGLNLHIHDVLLPSPIASFVGRKYNLPFRFQLSFDVQQPTTKIVYSDWKQKSITSHLFDTILQEQEIPTGTPSVTFSQECSRKITTLLSRHSPRVGSKWGAFVTELICGCVRFNPCRDQTNWVRL